MPRLCLLLLSFLLVAPAQALDCIIPHKVEQSMFPQEDCGSLDENSVFKPGTSLLNLIEFPDNAPACVILVGDNDDYLTHYVLPNGLTQTTLFFDNGCDYFEEGLARGKLNNKTIYFDKNLEIQIATDFEEGAPFYYGHAEVCNGPFIEKQEGEHTLQSGGQCGLIDRSGKLVVDANYTIEDQDVFTRYISSHNECEPPPIQNENDALCHARRHARVQDHHSDNWTWFEVEDRGANWAVHFIMAEDPDYKITMEINAESAHWNSIIPEKLKQ